MHHPDSKTGGAECDLMMPPDFDITTEFPEAASRIVDAVGPKDGDAVIFGEGADAPSALRAAVFAAMNTLTEQTEADPASIEG